MKAKISGIHHVAIKAMGVEKFNSLIFFYSEILGMPVVRKFGEGNEIVAMIDTGAGILELFANGSEDISSGLFQHIALATPSVDDCVEAVRSHGYEITVEPCNMMLGTKEHPYPVRLAFCLGPVGEEVEFFTEL